MGLLDVRGGDCACPGSHGGHRSAEPRRHAGSTDACRRWHRDRPRHSRHRRPGHTPGHVALSITSNDEQVLHISDVVLYPLHLEYPDWVPVFDILPEQAAGSRRRIFDRAAQERALVFAHHFPPFPNLGHVHQQEAGW
jgi:hypothetical protein